MYDKKMKFISFGDSLWLCITSALHNCYSLKLLEIIFNGKLNFKQYIALVSLKIARATGVLFKLRH